MAVTAFWYGLGLSACLNKLVDFDTDTIKVSLHTSTYVPAQDTHDYWDDATNEVTGTGYTAGGATLAGASITYTAATNILKLDGTDVTWTSATITARYAVIYGSTGTAATSPLIGYVDFGADVTSTAGDFKITWHADGILKITAS